LQRKPEDALRDLTLINDLCRINTNRPVTLVGAMINVAVRGLYASTIADGLRWKAWREPQLAALEEQLKHINLLRPLQESFQLERVGFCHTMEITPPVRLVGLFNNASQANSWQARKNRFLAGLIPHGWIYQNMVVVADVYPECVASLDPGSQTIFPDKADAATTMARAASSQSSPYTFLATLGIPNFNRADQTCARNQTALHQTLIACALERFHLAHSEYPETLDSLSPQFMDTIPHDVIGGQPLHYRRAADGTFILYSVGWSGKDGGGVRGKSVEDGDWGWPVLYP